MNEELEAADDQQHAEIREEALPRWNARYFGTDEQLSVYDEKTQQELEKAAWLCGA